MFGGVTNQTISGLIYFGLMWTEKNCMVRITLFDLSSKLNVMQPLLLKEKDVSDPLSCGSLTTRQASV